MRPRTRKPAARSAKKKTKGKRKPKRTAIRAKKTRSASSKRKGNAVTTKTKIESLTKEQQARLTEFRDKWMKIGLATGPANRQAAEQAVRDAYKVAGLEPPKIILWAQSPMSGLITVKYLKEFLRKYPANGEIGASVRASVWDSVRDSVGASVWDSVGASVRDSVRDSVGASVGASVWASVRDSVRDSVGASVRDSVRDSVGASVRASVRDSVRDSVGASVGASGLRDEWNELYCWGQHDANWLGFYDYFREVLGLKDCEKLDPLSRLAKEAGWTWLYKDAAIISERPIELHTVWNEARKRYVMHNPNGPAIKWADGYELFRMGGIEVPAKLATTPAAELNAQEWLKEENVDIRREAFQKIGMEKVVRDLGAETISTHKCPVGGAYELLNVDIGLDSKRPFLKMLNPSLKGIQHIEGVEGKTAEEALYLFRNDLTKPIPPITMDGNGGWDKVTDDTYGQTGDLLYFPLGFQHCKTPVASEFPKDAKRVTGNTIHLGNTGNHHGIKGSAFAILDHEGTRFLDIAEDALLTHEEHKDTKIPAGQYEVRHVKEKDHVNDLVRAVVD